MRQLTKPVRLTSKNQTSIPKEIREALALESGDTIVFEVLEDNTVIVRKSYPADFEYLNAVTSALSEWETEEDEKAYKDL